jgi:hypothetical protein
MISYGSRLPDSNYIGEYIFSRSNASLYQVSDTAFVLGFNPTNNKAEFLYHYSADNNLTENLLADPSYAGVCIRLTKNIQAFLQKTGMQYNSSVFK